MDVARRPQPRRQRCATPPDRRPPRRPARREDEVRSTEDSIVRRERDAEVFRALAEARPDDREAILLAASGYRTREIATQLGRTELATRALLCRARGRMRRSLAVLEPA